MQPLLVLSLLLRREETRTEYTLAQLGLDREQRARISTGRYAAGHMMYVHGAELAKLKRDVAAFIRAALGG